MPGSQLRPVAFWFIAGLLMLAAGCATSGVDSTDADGFGESPQEPVLTLNCANDFDEMVALLRSGLPTYDYEPAADLADLVERSNAVVTGEVMTVVRFGGHGDGAGAGGGGDGGRDGGGDQPGSGWTLVAAENDRLLHTFPEPVPEIPQFAVSSFWAGPDPDPVEAEIGFEDLLFVAFLNRFDAAPTGYAVDVQGLVVGCSGQGQSPVAIIEPLPVDGADRSIDELVASVAEISAALAEARDEGRSDP